MWTIDKIDSLEETLDVLMATVRTFEDRFGSRWDMTESVGYFRRIAPGVGAFRVEVTGAEGMFKPSQEQSGPVRAQVERSFRAHSDTRRQAVGDWMNRLT